MNVYYWSCISDRYARWDRYFRFVTAFAASGTVAAWSIWDQHPAVWKSLSAVACIVSICHPIFPSTNDLKRTSELVARWKEVSIKYELLWEQDSDLSGPGSWKRFETTKERESKIDETRLAKSGRLIRKAYDHVCQRRGLK